MNKIVLVLIIVAVIVAGIIGVYIAANLSKNLDLPGGSTSYETQGVKVEIKAEGTGEGAKVGDLLNVNYVSYLEDYTQIDNNYQSRPFIFNLGVGKVIKGWDNGLIGMKVGEKRTITVPADQAYGSQGFPSAGIPANAVLKFDVKLNGLVSVTPGATVAP